MSKSNVYYISTICKELSQELHIPYFFNTLNEHIGINPFYFFLKIFFLCGPFLKSSLNLLQYCFCFMFLVFWLRGMWDLSSPTRDWTCTPCAGSQSPNHGTTREVPVLAHFKDEEISSDGLNKFLPVRLLGSGTAHIWHTDVQIQVQALSLI